MALLQKLLKHRPYSQINLLVHILKRNKSITGYQSADNALNTVTGGKIYRWLDAYEDFVGLTEVRQAQETVTKAEVNYRHVQDKRRAVQQELSDVHGRMKDLTIEIEKAQRGTDTYLELVTKENDIIKQEKQTSNHLYQLDEDEKLTFGVLSSALRESHEKERARAERMKYWGLIGSVIGAVIGIVGTTINNYLRMKELRNIVTTSAGMNEMYRTKTVELCESVTGQYQEMSQTLSDIQSQIGLTPLKSKPEASQTNKPKLEQGGTENKLNDLIEVVKSQESLFKKELQEVSKAVAKQHAICQTVDGNVVYINDQEFKSMLDKTEKNLEFKMKLQALGTVTLVYAAAAVAIPILLHFFPGSGGGS